MRRGGVPSLRARRPQVDVRGIISLLSSLYRNRAEAVVRENIQNSIDAGARNIWITLEPTASRATFVDDGSGIPLPSMTSKGYFALRWSTKRGKDLIGSKGIGRLANLAVAKRVRVETRNEHQRAAFIWYPSGSHLPVNASPCQPEELDHGVVIRLEDLPRRVIDDLPRKAEEVATRVFDEWLRKGVKVWLDGVEVKAKEYHGRRTTQRLAWGSTLELYWDRGGQSPEDQGIILRNHGVRVGPVERFGIDSQGWRNLAGILNLDHFPLTANREAFEETAGLLAVRSEAARRVRLFLARNDGLRRQRLDALAERYTRAARAALEGLDLDIALLGRGRRPGAGEKGCRDGPDAPAEAEATGSPSAPVGGLPAGDHLSATEREGPGSGGVQRGFRLVPKDFALDTELVELKEEMSAHRGPTIFVNIAHPACPSNRYARSFYIWCVGFFELVRWGALGPQEEISRTRLIHLYQAWLTRWSPELARFTPGAEDATPVGDKRVAQPFP